MLSEGISLLIGIVAIVTFVLILIFVKPRKYPSKANRSQPKTTTSILVEQYNQCVSIYNKLTSAIDTKVHNLIRVAMICNDTEAMNAVNSFVEQINKRCEYLDDYFTRANDCFSNRDEVGANYCISAMKSDLEIMQDLKQQLDQIVVQRRAPKTETAPQTTVSKTLYHFFDGCKTKEEADARYRNLSRAFHPDTKGGDIAMFQEMQQEYESMIKEFANE